MKHARALAPFVVALLLTVGCSSTSPVSQVDPTAQAEVVTIRLAVPQDAKAVMSELLIPAFEAKYAHYRVASVVFQKTNDLRDAAKKGQADVVVVPWVSRSDVPSLVQPLDGYLTKASFDARPYGSLMEDLRVGGRTHDFPYAVDLGLLVYDPDKVKAAGVAIPTDAWTWDEFRAAVAKLPQGQGEQKVWGLETIFHEDLLQLWLEGKTGKPVWEADLATLREGIGFFHTMVFTDQSMVLAPAYNITSDGISSSYSRYRWDSLKAGKAAMTFEERVGAGDFNYLNRSQIRWDVAPMPAAPGARPILPVYPRTLGIAAGSSQPDAAWDFIAFATGQEGAVVLARAGHAPAYLNDETRRAWSEHQPAYPPGMDAIWEATWKAGMNLTPPGDQYDHRWMEFKKAQNWALSGRKSLDDALGWFVANEGGR